MCVCVRHLSVCAECKAGDAVRVSVVQQGHGLDGEDVPHTHVWILPHLTRRHQGTLRVQRQAEEGGQPTE